MRVLTGNRVRKVETGTRISFSRHFGLGRSKVAWKCLCMPLEGQNRWWHWDSIVGVLFPVLRVGPETEFQNRKCLQNCREGLKCLEIRSNRKIADEIVGVKPEVVTKLQEMARNAACAFQLFHAWPQRRSIIRHQWVPTPAMTRIGVGGR